MSLVIAVIHYFVLAITWLLIASVVLSYFMSPFHPVRQTIDRIVQPLLIPIRRILPQTGMIDFSPLVLIILLQIIEFVLIRLLVSL